MKSHIKIALSHLFMVLSITCFLIPVDAEYRRDVYLGGIFAEKDYESQMAFEYAIASFNSRFISQSKVRFKPMIRTMAEFDSFKSEKLYCNLTASGVAAIFGPNSIESRGIVQSISEALEIPHIDTYWAVDTQRRRPDYFSLNFYPKTNMLANAIAALVEDYGWKTCTIFYEEDDGIVRYQEVLKRHNPEFRPIAVRKISIGTDNRSIFKNVQNSGETNIILDCKAEHIIRYLKQAHEVNLMGDYQVYILTSLDAHTIDLSELQHIRSNITSLRVINPNDRGEYRNIGHFLTFWEEAERRTNSHRIKAIPQRNEIKLDTALMHDAVNHFALAYIKFNTDDRPIYEEKLNCSRKSGWQFGLDLLNFAKNAPSEGFSGSIALNDDGEREEFALDILELVDNNFRDIGKWNSGDQKILNTRTKIQEEIDRSKKIKDKVFKVVSRIGKPYLDFAPKKSPDEVLTGNARYQGYSMDLIDGIAKSMNIKYEFYLVEDGNYGKIDPKTGQWNGLIKDLLDRKADMAICDLTITYDRKTAVDFTMPFMNLGISILYSKGKKEDPALFSFTEPLSMEVWIYMGTAFLGVSLLLFILARMAPKEWCNPHPCDPEPEELENALTLLNSMWLSMGSFLQQGSDILPKATSTRMVAGMWWFFTLIMISSYTANLAAFLTNDKLETTISSVEDLAKQAKIKYGTVVSGSSFDFFKQSNFSTYARMWTTMEGSRPSVFVKTNAEGVARVKNGRKKYAFLMESTSIEYEIERDCELTKIGNQLDSKGYGIAMPMNSPWRAQINEALLKMQEKGTLVLLKNKWWKEMDRNATCDTSSAKVNTAAAELGIKNIGGVFLVLGIGCSIAAFIGLLEFLWNVRETAVKEKVTMMEALIAEIKFATNIWKTTKPVHPVSESNSSRYSRSNSGNRGTSRVRDSSRNIVEAASSFMHLDKAF